MLIFSEAFVQSSPPEVVACAQLSALVMIAACVATMSAILYYYDCCMPMY